MREMIKMVVVLTVLSAFSGGLLAAIRNGTQERIEYQQLVFVKGPAIRAIMEGSANDPIVDRFKLKRGDGEQSFFVGKFDGEANTVAFETYGKGFGGDVGVMVGVNVKTDQIVGVRVTTHSETPGVGSKAKDDPKQLVAQFPGMPLKDAFKVKADGGSVDAMAGATVTSRGVAMALTQASAIYSEVKPQVVEQLKSF